jgi:Sel1 repeat
MPNSSSYSQPWREGLQPRLRPWPDRLEKQRKAPYVGHDKIMRAYGVRSCHRLLLEDVMQRIARSGNIFLVFTHSVLDALKDGVAAFDRNDYIEANRLLRPLADENEEKAEYYLGAMYLTGAGVEQSFEAAAKWFQKAADQNDADAQYNLGVLQGRANRACVWMRPEPSFEFGSGWGCRTLRRDGPSRASSTSCSQRGLAGSRLSAGSNVGT